MKKLRRFRVLNLGGYYPVAVGRSVATLNLDPELTTTMYLQSLILNLAAAAMRLVPLGQVDGQKVQINLTPNCIKIANQLRSATLDDLHNNASVFDIHAPRNSIFTCLSLIRRQIMALKNGPLRIGIGGPVRAGKTILTAALAKILQPKSSPMTSTRKKTQTP